ncbi:MAG: hypothetical protein EGQ45_08225, partial [Clostridiales bacterium]|nr:hypothetical protein [Clostridiales bacterium]
MRKLAYCAGGFSAAIFLAHFLLPGHWVLPAALAAVICFGGNSVLAGGLPKLPDNQPLSIVNYDDDRRRPVADGRLMAWGELTYAKP